MMYRHNSMINHLIELSVSHQDRQERVRKGIQQRQPKQRSAGNQGQFSVLFSTVKFYVKSLPEP